VRRSARAAHHGPVLLDEVARVGRTVGAGLEAAARIVGTDLAPLAQTTEESVEHANRLSPRAAAKRCTWRPWPS
jgi:hypothetical protein